MSSNGTGFVFLTVICGIFAAFIYILPTLIAFRKKHRNRYVILLINVALGGTLLAWLGTLIWAMNRVDNPVKGGTKYDLQPNAPSL